MGVPGFFKFLMQKYPKIVCKCIEEKERGKRVLPDPLGPNPKKEEFDVLYIDMNSIIHHCMRSHPKSESDLLDSIFKHLDRIFLIVRPRKLVYIAIDGVAPKAKMNQQRSRRFQRSNKEPAEHQTTSNKGNHMDTNCITPGTEFMSTLSSCVHYCIHIRLKSDGWKNISVIFSDANVPGEGEHKIVDFIRRQRKQPSYDLSTKHVLCGPDADLIMLGLATHEANITIIREQNQQYVFVHLAVLRNYLEMELKVPDLPFPFDLERAIDDWVFLWNLIGNDFLPGLPFLNDSFDTLVEIYQDCISQSKQWATENGRVNFEVVQLILSQIERTNISHIQKKAPYKMTKRNRGPDPSTSSSVKLREPDSGSVMEPKPDSSHDGSSQNKRKFQRTSMGNWTPAFKKRREVGETTPSTSAESRVNVKEDDEAQVEENEDSWSQITFEYVRGLCWITKYYSQCVPSWTWFYPYKHAPRTSDITVVSSSYPDFAAGTQPLRPLEQLMAVLPPSSWRLVPRSWGKLMTDQNSPIIDFYRMKFGRRDPLFPFVEEEKLIEALSKVYPELSEDENQRNIVGEMQLYVGKQHKGYDYLRGLFGDFPSQNVIQEVELDPTYIGGICGAVFASNKCVKASKTLASPIQGMKALQNCHVVCVSFKNPVLDVDFHEPSRNHYEKTHSMEALGVVPDIVDVCPPATITIKYDNELGGSTVDGGNELKPSLVQNQPTHVEWPIEEGTYYTLCMTDPDAPSRTTPNMREWHHWLVVNIPGNDIKKGEVLSEYVGPVPPESTGLHRYVFLVYKQLGLLNCDEPRLTNRSSIHREKFSVRKFAEKYYLGQPIAGNMYQAKWDDCVPQLLEQLGED